jgi:fructokinase
MFLVCGEALFDLFVRPSNAGKVPLDAVPGGSPFNVALGLARLGQHAEFFSGLSKDLMGRKLAQFIEVEGIGLAHAKYTPGPTALSIVELNDQGSPDYAFYGHRPAYQTLTESDLPHLPDAIRVIHLGSIATVLQPTAGTLASLVERECGARLVAYDPNVRPSIEPDLDVWRQALARLSASSHLIKVSAEDLAILFPEADRDAIARRWLGGGTRLVVVTDGAHGATAWTCGGGKLHCPQPPVEVIDTVGAGDSFQAALLAGLAELNILTADALGGISEPDLQRLLQFAGAAAAKTCGRRGADLPARDAIPIRFSA